MAKVLPSKMMSQKLCRSWVKSTRRPISTTVDSLKMSLRITRRSLLSHSSTTLISREARPEELRNHGSVSVVVLKMLQARSLRLK